MKEKINKFMQGRYGVDQLSVFMTYFAILLLLVLFLLNKADWSWLAMIIVLISYMRLMSRDIGKRSKENAKYMAITRNFTGSLKKMKNHIVGTKDHKYFTCDSCKTELRIPKKKGKIKVKCPKCGKEFIKRT